MLIKVEILDFYIQKQVILLLHIKAKMNICEQVIKKIRKAAPMKALEEVEKAHMNSKVQRSRW